MNAHEMTNAELSARMTALADRMLADRLELTALQNEWGRRRVAACNARLDWERQHPGQWWDDPDRHEQITVDVGR